MSLGQVSLPVLQFSPSLSFHQCSTLVFRSCVLNVRNSCQQTLEVTLLLFVTRVLSQGQDSGSQSERQVTPRRVWTPNSEVPARGRASCPLAASPQPRDSSTSTCLGSRHLKVWLHKLSYRLSVEVEGIQLSNITLFNGVYHHNRMIWVEDYE